MSSPPVTGVPATAVEGAQAVPVVLVTGAGGGIGTAICTAFADAGWQVAAHARQEGGSAPGARPPGDGRAALVTTGDLGEPGTCEQAVADVLDRLGRLDALVCAAALQDLAGFLDPDDATWHRLLEVNLVAVHRLVRAAAPALARTGGSIVAIASVEAHDPMPDHAAYAASKAALVQHARSAAQELGPMGIRANTVSPGLVHRPGIEGGWPEGVDRWTAAAPLGRLVAPEEVAAACLFLCSPAASGISGIDLPVDAGMGARPRW